MEQSRELPSGGKQRLRGFARGFDLGNTSRMCCKAFSDGEHFSFPADVVNSCMECLVDIFPMADALRIVQNQPVLLRYALAFPAEGNSRSRTANVDQG